MAVNNIIESAQVEQSYIIIKFSISPSALTLNGEDFQILDSSGDPVSSTSNGLKSIELANDYESISRRLKLRFANSMSPGEYFLKVISLKDATGAERVDPEDPVLIPFHYNYTEPLPEESHPEAGRPPIEVKDYSIKDYSLDPQDSVYEPDDEFFVSSVEPEQNAIFVALEDDDSGLIVIEFSTAPNSLEFDEHIKLQRKPMGRGARWEDIAFTSFLDDNTAELIIDEGFAANYKYRLRILSTLASADATPDSLGSTFESLFTGDIDPLLIDPDEIQMIYPDATAIEAGELIFRYSQEVKDLYKNAEIDWIALEYIRAATLCALSRRFGDAGDINGQAVTLGDLKIESGNATKINNLNAANARTWCELAWVYRTEMTRGKMMMKAVNRSVRQYNPIPNRNLSVSDRRYGGYHVRKSER